MKYIAYPQSGIPGPGKPVARASVYDHRGECVATFCATTEPLHATARAVLCAEALNGFPLVKACMPANWQEDPDWVKLVNAYGFLDEDV